MLARLCSIAAIAFCVCAAPATAAIRSGISGWYWGSPQPQGYDLNAIEFEGTTGYAAAAFGTVLRTVDGGATWTTFYAQGGEPRFDLLDVIDADSLVVAAGCFLVRFDASRASYPTVRCERPLTAVSFPTSDVGYLRFEGGTLWKTTDGGNSFSSSVAPIPNANAFGDVAFATADVGLATGGDKVFRTTDGGRSWVSEFDADVPLKGLFVRGSTAVAVGDAGTFLLSTDGGDTWTNRSGQDPGPLSFTDVRCSVAGVCLMTTGNGGQLVRTTDAGESFELVDGYGTAVDFASSTRAVAVGLGGLTQLSNDAGATFASLGSRVDGYTPPATPLSSRISRIRATSADVAYAAGSRGLVAGTVSGGRTWTTLTAPTDADVQDVSFTRVGSGFVLDVRGGLFRTNNGGENWRVLDPKAPERPLAVHAYSESVVLLVSPRVVLRSADAGRHFRPVRRRPLRRRTLLNIDPAGFAVVAFGPRAIVASRDGGRSWRRIRRPTKKHQIDGLDFRSARSGWVVQSDGRVFATRDAGRSWTESLAVGRSNAARVAFATADAGWLRLDVGVGMSPATVLRTSDGGKSWAPQIVARTFERGGELSALAAAGPNAGFAAAQVPVSGIPVTGLFYTQDDGQAGGPTELTLRTSHRIIDEPTESAITGRILPKGLAPYFPIERLRGSISVFYRRLKGARWQQVSPAKFEEAGPGTFRFKQEVARSTIFVAQWEGDGFVAGDGTEALVIRRR